MANFDSDKITNADPARGGVGLQSISAYVALTDALAQGDFIRFFKLPKGAVILHIWVDVTDIDEATALEWDLGNVDDPDKYIDGSTVGQSAGTDELDTGKRGTVLTDEETLQAKIITAAGTPAAGYIACTCLYAMQTQDACVYA